MDLLPPHIRGELARYPIGSQSRRGMDALVVVKYFFPSGRYTLFVTEAEFDGDDVNFYGYCLSPLDPSCDEWGYASFEELRSTRVRGLMIERDLHFPLATRTVAEALKRHAA
jgi:Protein of unknown function (DUF2958)